MARRSCVTASLEQMRALKELARSERRDEADRARGMLLSLEGWTSEAIGTAFGVTANSVRHWRNWYATGGVEGLRAAVVSGPSGERGLRALWIAAAILSEPVENRRTRRSLGSRPRSSGGVARRSRRARIRMRRGRRRPLPARQGWWRGWRCARPRPRRATLPFSLPTSPRRSPIPTSPMPGPDAVPTCGSRRQGRPGRSP